jgi:DNA-binding NtrC family response regulator
LAVTDDKTVTLLKAGGPSAQIYAVRVLTGPDAGHQLPLRPDRTVSIGSSTDNDFVLSDRTVSRYHIELRPAPGGVMVKDLGSLNGTFFQNARIQSAVLPVGAQLRLGESTLAIDVAPPAPAAAPEVAEIPGLVAESAAMRRVVATIAKLAPTMVSVLLEGETGTGKEVVASAIHGASSRAKAPFVIVDCGALPPSLIASELFGHERGAFTGAAQRHVGAFERAKGGTLFLDEIGELPLELQPALLGVLERRRFRRLGGERDVDADFRLLSATNRDLRADANSGRFRNDLYFRLAVSRIVIPPLRERPEDVAPLARHFAEHVAGTAQPAGLSDELLGQLAGQHWAGNARELRNYVENAIALGFEPKASVAKAVATDGEDLEPYKVARANAVTEFERDYLSRLIAACDGNASAAARLAQMDRAYLLSLLRRHGLR